MSILKKLELLLNKGISSELEVVYLMSGLRKLLEQQRAKDKYRYLKFYCDWTLHSKLEGSAAQDILGKFNAANIHFKAGLHLHQLPDPVRNEINNISKMKYFESELTAFLKENGLPSIDVVRQDGWIHFVHFYAKVVEDCPLVISSKNAITAGIDRVTVSVEQANEALADAMLFRVTWTILDKNGESGDLFIINSLRSN